MRGRKKELRSLHVHLYCWWSKVNSCTPHVKFSQDMHPLYFLVCLHLYVTSSFSLTSNLTSVIPLILYMHYCVNFSDCSTKKQFNRRSYREQWRLWFPKCHNNHYCTPISKLIHTSRGILWQSPYELFPSPTPNNSP